MLSVVAVLAAAPVTEGLLRILGPGYDGPAARSRATDLVATVLGDDAFDAALDTGIPQAPQQRVLHPYFGYDMPNGEDLIERYVDMHHREDRDALFTVLVCGGSVPEIFVGIGRGASDVLSERLLADPRVAGKNVQVCRLARAGYKQPQQLEKLAYVFSRGVRPDVVVNVDGLNEVRQGSRNPRVGLHPTWPSGNHWLHLKQGAPTPESVAALVELTSAREAFLSVTRSALDRGYFHSALLGRLTERRMDARFRRWFDAHEVYTKILAPPLAEDWTEEKEVVALEEELGCWAESSRLMHVLCRDAGAVYVHLLQPTLEDTGSKPLSQKERRGALGGEEPKPFVHHAYDRLRTVGATLAAEGVPFVDTSGMFADVTETLYYDRAHFGREGNVLLAERMAQEILSRL